MSGAILKGMYNTALDRITIFAIFFDKLEFTGNSLRLIMNYFALLLYHHLKRYGKLYMSFFMHYLHQLVLKAYTTVWHTLESGMHDHTLKGFEVICIAWQTSGIYLRYVN